MKKFLLFFLSFLLLVGCNINSTSTDLNDNKEGNRVTKLNLFLPTFTSIRTVDTIKGGLIITGIYNFSATIAVISDEGKILKSLTLKDNLFINDTAYDPAENALYIGGQYGNKYAYVGKYDIASNKIEWERTFGSEVGNREHAIRSLELEGNSIFFVGYGKANYTIDVRMAGKIDVDGNGLSWNIIDNQPGSVNSYYNDLVILNDHFIISGNEVDQGTDPFKYGCLTAYGNLPSIGDVTDNFNNPMDVRFCMGLGKMAVSPEFSDVIFVLGVDADDEYGTNERIFVGTLSPSAIWQNNIYPITPTSSTSQGFVITGISAFDSNPVKIVVVGSAGVKYIIQKLNFINGEFNEVSRIIKNCPSDGDQNRCDLNVVRFIGRDKFIVAGSSNYRGWIFTGNY